MVAINSLPPQDSTWIKVTIKEKCRVFFYDQTSSDLIHLKRLKRMNTKTAPPTHTHAICINQYNICISSLKVLFKRWPFEDVKEGALKNVYWGKKKAKFCSRAKLPM